MIWKEFDSFTAHARKLEQVTVAVAGMIETRADPAPATKQVGRACGAWHSTFRE